MHAIDNFATAPMWAGFIAFVLAMLALDLFALGDNKAHRVSVKEAGAWVVVWVTLALSFGALLCRPPRLSRRISCCRHDALQAGAGEMNLSLEF